MTAGKKLTIALSIAIPLLVLGSGLALAAGEPDLGADGKAIVPGYAFTPASVTTAALPTCSDCTGLCDNSGGQCNADCTGDCNQDCSGSCRDAGACPSSRSCGGGGSGCGRLAAAGTSSACPSCDVVGLNEYPANSPRATSV